MSLSTGTRLGSYEILSALGSGGMGEVYRARDTKLKRDVAIKVLPEVFSQDPDRLARFEREAEVLATLNHSNIAAIYGLEESNGVQALVLELVEGPTLADRIAQAPMPLDDVLPIARQIAQALEAAHARGIIHRDLKPANIKLRPDGTVKVLDFGLAKAFDKRPLAGDLTQSPTLLSPSPTLAGVILGTATYMSPEQARGKAVDTRTDVWAFGCVMFEMLTGTKPFDGDTLADIVAAIVKNDPDWWALPAGTPRSVRSLVGRCLRKDPAERLHDIADARFQIEDAMNDPGGSAAKVLPARNRREWAAWIAAVLFLGAALFFAVRPAIESSTPDPISFTVFPPENVAFSAAINTTVNVPSLAISPDGRALVFSAAAPGASPVLWLRSMDRVGARPLAGTENAQDPLWSPDNRWIGFFADGKLKKVPAAGGAVQVITETATDFRGGTWGLDDTILFASGTGPILAVNAAGGKSTPVTNIDASRHEGAHRNPQFLPDGRHFLYTILGSGPEVTGVYLGSLDGKTKTLLIPVRASAVYAPPGFLLFVDGSTLLGQGFDANRLELRGQPFLIAEHVGRNSTSMSAVSASRSGAIAYADIISRNGSLTWIGRDGHPLGSGGIPEGDYTDFRLSPDETRLAVSLVDPRNNTVEIWLTDLSRSSTSRLAAGGVVTSSALWSPDSTRLMFRSNRTGVIEFYERSAAGGGNDRLVLSAETYRAAAQIQALNLVLTDWSPDGRQIIFTAPALASGNDLWVLPLGGKPEKVIASPGEQIHGNFSPDGRLVAYTSNESGKFEVYVETIPPSDRKWPVSTNGGYEPRWRSDGREIYYLSADRKLMTVPVGAGPSFGIPKTLFQTRVPAEVISTRTHYVPSRDGQRFLVNTALDAAASPITVVLNWTATLQK
jgi:serine/threonine protein kinase/Tol biopolymer transport system component